MRKIVQDEAFTGLEAAIVLIAFVVVAAVFSYVVLGAGFFTTQKSQEVVHTGVAEASSTMQIVGDVYGLDNTGTGKVDQIRFSLSLAAGGTPVDMTKVQMTWSTASTLETIDPINATAGYLINHTTTAHTWNVSEMRFGEGTANDNNLLEAGEVWTIYVQPSAAIGPNTKFDLEIKPSIGASVGLIRTIPAGVNAVNKLY
jgi:flagellin FlaB